MSSYGMNMMPKMARSLQMIIRERPPKLLLHSCLQQILAMAEIREDVEQHLRRIEGRRQLLTEQKVAEQRRLLRMLDAQLKEACDGCHAQEHELRDLLAEVLGQLHAFTGASSSTCLCCAGLHSKFCSSSKLILEPELTQ